MTGKTSRFGLDAEASAVDGCWGELAGSHRRAAEAEADPQPRDSFSTGVVNGPA